MASRRSRGVLKEAQKELQKTQKELQETPKSRKCGQTHAAPSKFHRLFEAWPNFGPQDERDELELDSSRAPSKPSRAPGRRFAGALKRRTRTMRANLVSRARRAARGTAFRKDQLERGTEASGAHFRLGPSRAIIMLGESVFRLFERKVFGFGLSLGLRLGSGCKQV